MPIVQADVLEMIWYNEDAAAPMTVTKPASFGPDKILLALIIQHGGSLTDLTAHADWTMNDSDSVSSINYKLWSHPYTGTEGATWSFGYGGGSDVCLGLAVITGADMTPTLVVNSTGFGETTSSMDSGSVTPTDYIDLLITFLAFWGNGTPLTAIDPGSMADLGQTQVAGDFMSLAAAKENLASSVPTGVRTWTSVPTVATPGFTISIAVDSLGTFDPDPPLKPPAVEVPPWVIQRLIKAKQQRWNGAFSELPTPVIKQSLSGNADGTSVLLNTASDTTDEHLLVAIHSADFDVVDTMTTPTGGTWVLKTTADNGTNSFHTKIWTRTADIGVNSVTFPAVGSAENFGSLVVISGADLVTPSDDAAGSNGAASTSHIAPSVNTIIPSDLLINTAIGAVTNYTKPNPQAQTTEIIENDGNFSTQTVAAQTLAADGPTGTMTFISSASSAYASASIAIRPAGAAAGGIPDSNISAGAIDSSEAFGVPDLFAEPTVVSAGITSSEEVGNPTVTVDSAVNADAISSSERLGNATVTTVTTVAVNGIISSELIGNSLVSPAIDGDGITSAASIGSPTVTTTATVAAQSITSSELVGNPNVVTAFSINANGIPGQDRLGSPNVTTITTISAGSISSSEKLGSPTTSTFVAVQSITSSENVGNSSVQSIVSANGIRSSELVGSPTVTTTVTVLASGIVTSETFGSSNTQTATSILASSISSSEIVGNPSILITPVVSAQGIKSTESVGSPSVTTTVSVAVHGITSNETFGSSNAQTATSIIASGITSSGSVGSASVSTTVSVAVNSIVSNELFGNANAVSISNVIAQGIVSNQSVGSPSITVITAINAGSITTSERFGLASVVSTITINAASIRSNELFGAVQTGTAVSIFAGGIVSTERFGAPQLVPGSVNVAVHSISSEQNFGNFLVSLGIPETFILAGSIYSFERFGNFYIGRAVSIDVVGRIESELIEAIIDSDIIATVTTDDMIIVYP